MGMLTRQTREELSKWEADPHGEAFTEFLDDVAESGLREACEARLLTQGATLTWIGAHDSRSEAYSAALRVKGEVLVHEALSLVDDEAVDVQRAKLRTGLRMQVAGHWSERYRPRVNVQHAGKVEMDAGLLGFASELLERISAPRRELTIEAEGAVLIETVAVAAVGKRTETRQAAEPVRAAAAILPASTPAGESAQPKPERLFI